MGQILDAFGFPASSSGGGGRLYDSTRPDSKRRPTWETRVEPLHRAVGYWDWKTIVSTSRRLCANFPILDAAIEARSTHAIGRAWAPVHMGEKSAAVDKWLAKVIPWLTEEWFEICDIEGSNYTFVGGLYLNSTLLDLDGDFCTVLTQTADGYPQIQTLASDRIGMRSGSSAIVGDRDATTHVTEADGTVKQIQGAYKNLRIELGVIFNAAGAPVAVRVLGGTQAEDQDISLRDCIFKFDPKHRRQARGLPVFAGSLEFLAQSFETHDAEARALMLSSFIALVEKSATGGDPTDAANDSREADDPSLHSETYEKGLIKHLYSTGSLDAHTSERPSEQWTAFQDRIIRIAVSRIWPYSLCWKPDGMNGTQERSAIEQARSFVQDRQDVLRPVARRTVGWAISKAIKLGILPEYPGSDKAGQLKWDFEMPPEFSIDHGREDEQWRENFKMGESTMGERLRKMGKPGDVKAHYLARAREQAQKQVAIQEAEAEFGVSIDPREVQMFTPNDQSQAQAGTEPVDTSAAA